MSEQKESTLPIYEHFHSFQGEGTHMGYSAYFIRTYGCPIKCPWCDSIGTWHPAHKNRKVERLSISKLTQLAKDSTSRFVVITGGEPAIHDLTELTQSLKQQNLPVHLETSGAYPIKGEFNWITMSPKRFKHPLEENLLRANEIKLIIENQQSFEYWVPIIKPYLMNKTIWLHPEWSNANHTEILHYIANIVKNYPGNLRAGFQIHKLYNVD